MKKISLIIILFLAAFVLSGCTNKAVQNKPASTKSTNGSVIKSFDGGKSWENKVNLGENKNIGNINVLSMAISNFDSRVLYIGTEKNGIYLTRNGGELWEKTSFGAERVYGIGLDFQNAGVIYASGVFEKRGKIYKSLDEGKNWKEIYTEPSEGTMVTALMLSPANSGIIYAGTNKGMIFKSSDGGQSWKNIYNGEGIVSSIAIDSGDSNIAYFAIFGKGIFRTKDGGGNFENLKKPLGEKLESDEAVSIAADPNQSGIIYVGLKKGIARGSEFGDKFEDINILESSRSFPVRAVAINPKNSKEIIYSAAQAIYKSIDGGMQWSTFQVDSEKIMQVLKYDSQDPSIIYAGMREI